MNIFHNISRRTFISFLIGFTVFFYVSGEADSFAQKADNASLQLAVFDVDATPPVGSRLAYNKMINTWDLGLRAKGIVITGAGQPVVLCSVDWIGIANEGHDVFRKALADAAGTVPQRVAVHTIHQHDAPACDFAAERLLKSAGFDPMAFEGSFAREVISRLETAIKQSLEKPQPVTHIGLGEARVYEVASARRILGDDGKVRITRYSSAANPAVRAEPEGVIDPMVSLVSFWNNDKPVAVLSYYATHPQSYYGTGIPNPDYPGVARFIRQLAVPNALHIHFNGAGGDVTAGKYNDGSKENRGILGERLADGMKRAWEATEKFEAKPQIVRWSVEPVALPPSKNLEGMKAQAMENIKNGKRPWDNENVVTNNMSKIPFLERCKEGRKIDIGCLTVGRGRILFMPGELAVEYQLAAKEVRKDLFIAMAAYGDYGMGYISTEAQYSQGGYEAGPASAVAPEVENVLMGAVKKLLNEK
jgi:hypothetical protein